MAAISVRDLDETVASRMKVRAARHGRSMEAEVRAILTDAVAADSAPPFNLAQAVRERFIAIGGIDLDIAPRRDMPRPATLPDQS